MGKTSKRGWRNIKLTEEMTTMASKSDAAELDSRADTLFTLDSSGSKEGISKKVLREIALQNKHSKPAAALSELPLLKKALKTVSRPIKRQNTNKKTLTDLWADESLPKNPRSLLPSSILRRESFAPAVVPTGRALSVNPVKSEFEQLIVQSAEKLTAPKTEVKAPVSSAETQNEPNSVPAVSETAGEKVPEGRKTKAQRLKEKAHKQLMKEHEIRRKEKELRRLEHDKTGRIAKKQAIEERRAQKLKTTAQRIVAQASGQYTLPRGAGGRLVAAEESVPTEIATSLRRIVPVGNPLLERRASLLKRRMIEQVPEINNEYKEKVRFARMDAKKAVKMLDKEARDRCVLLG